MPLRHLGIFQEVGKEITSPGLVDGLHSVIQPQLSTRSKEANIRTGGWRQKRSMLTSMGCPLSGHCVWRPMGVLSFNLQTVLQE